MEPVTIGMGVGGVALGAIVIGFMMKGGQTKKQKEIEAELDRIKGRITDEGRAEIARLKSEESGKFLKQRQVADQEVKDREDKVRDAEKRLDKREDALDRRLSTLERKEQDLTRKEQDIVKLEQSRKDALAQTANRQKELDQVYVDQKAKLQNIAGLTLDQAKALLMERVNADIAVEVNDLTARQLSRAKENADQDAKKIILNTIQRLASEYVAENTVASLELPNDELKGRIIGREGRNIRAFEKATGVDVIVDDTPGVVVLSCFEPVRREIARVALEKLVGDGRIHPSRIEESVAKATAEVTASIDKAGKDAAIEFGCHDLNPRLRNMLGRLRFRTSYGQNVLNHSREVAHICGLLAAELKLDIALAKRCGLLHDCGKALDQEMEGTHPAIGMDVAKQCEERIEVCEAIGGHHGDIEIHSLYPVLVTVADAISASRPGARRESLDKYVTRMKRLEEIACSKKGIEKAFAIQAGREVRVIAKADELDDSTCASVARDIAKQIEDELSYPGEVRVTLIRESRFVEYAR